MHFSAGVSVIESVHALHFMIFGKYSSESLFEDGVSECVDKTQEKRGNRVLFFRSIFVQLRHSLHNYLSFPNQPRGLSFGFYFFQYIPID